MQVWLQTPAILHLNSCIHKVDTDLHICTPTAQVPTPQDAAQSETRGGKGVYLLDCLPGAITPGGNKASRVRIQPGGGHLLQECIRLTGMCFLGLATPRFLRCVSPFLLSGADGLNAARA